MTRGKTGRLKWCLDSAEKRAVQSAMFKIPSLEERRGIKVGDFAKLIFLADPPPSLHPRGERMWVKVVELTAEIPRRYVGELVSDPVLLAAEQGDLVPFGPEHVADIYVERPR